MAAGTDGFRDTLREQLKLFVPAFTAGHTGPLVTEVRAFEVAQKWGRPKDEFGFFDLADPTSKSAFWDAMLSLVDRPPAEQPEGIYLVVNPIDPSLLGRANGRLKQCRKGLGAADKDVLRRRWLLIDVDAKRAAGISATDAEKAAARGVFDGVVADLAGRGWRQPMLIDSGNGFHAWYRIDLPADDGGAVERCIKGLAARHNTPAAAVDTSVFNPSRIMKLPGTWARKGDALPDRPHRPSIVLEVPT